MKKALFTFLYICLTATLFAQQVNVKHLQCEYKQNPAGIEAAPNLSWELQSNQQNVIQKAYQVLVADNLASLQKNQGNIWDSKKVNAKASIQVIYSGKKLEPAKTYYWKVRVWDNQNQQSNWSETSTWQTGLFSAEDWKGAQWIAYQNLPDSSRILPSDEQKKDKTGGTLNDMLPLLRKNFTVKRSIKQATIFISGLGHFELSLNGKKVGDHFLDPGWTNYEKQALYVPFDVTRELKQGANAIGVMLGNGFYYITNVKKRYKKLLVQYGYPKMICRLAITYSDGSTENIISNKTWKATPGPITFSSIYGGEDYNANLEQCGWNNASFTDQKWANAITVSGPPQLNSQMAEPLKVMESFSPVKTTKIKNDVWVYDLGQNASGIPQISVKGKKGDTIRIIPAELINEDGTANQKGTGRPYYLNYILKGTGIEKWQPRFTYYGFRYLQVEGGVPLGENNSKKLPVLSEVKGLHTRNSAATAGSFACSNPLFNKTFKLIDWAIKSNMASVFTDCPHREKLGWLEELHLMGSSVRYNFQVQNLLKKSVADMRLAQMATGLIPEISPEFTVFTWGGDMFRDSPEWGSSSILVPWYLYQWYGDVQELKESYSMMQRYATYLEKKSANHILSQGLGDWYDLGPKPPGVSQLTPMGITGTAIYYEDLTILQKAAKLLGKTEDAGNYQQLAAEVRASFNTHFFNPQTKQYGTGSQTANAMAVYMQLVEPQYKAAVVNNIVKDIRSRNNSLSAGDIGYRYLLRVLEQEGKSDVIFDMNSRSDVPGYGFQLAKGATALTESWQALTSVSNNHFMLGHILEWFYSGLAGIRNAEDGIAFNKIDIKPEPVGDLTFVKASYNSPYGIISSDWKKNGNTFSLSVEIPANTTATIYLPANTSSKITEGNQVITAKIIDQRAEIKVGSGKYQFTVNNF
jgi:alpha-L-rhamnosidase